MVSPGPYNSKYLDSQEPIFQSYTEIYGPLLNDRSPLSASMEIMILKYEDYDRRKGNAEMVQYYGISDGTVHCIY